VILYLQIKKEILLLLTMLVLPPAVVPAFGLQLAKCPQLVVASPWALAHYLLVSTILHQDQSQSLTANPILLYLTITDSFLYLDYSYFPLLGKLIHIHSPPIKSHNIFLQRTQFYSFTRIQFSSAPQFVLVSSSPEIAGLLCRYIFCSGMIGESGGGYGRNKGSHETTKSPRAWTV